MGELKVRKIEQKIALGEEVYSLDSSIKNFGDIIRKYLDDELRPKNFVDYCKDRKSGNTSSATIACNISHMRAVFKTAKALSNVGIDNTYCLINFNPTHIWLDW